MKQNPGQVSLKFNVIDPKESIKVSMNVFDKGITVNEDLTEYLLANRDIEINVLL
jgi:hypothetical protein